MHICAWQSADSRVTTDHCRVTLRWDLQNVSWLVGTSKSLFDSQSTVAWPPTTVAWPFSDFFRNSPKLLETYKKRCLTVSRRSRDLRPLSRDRSATFFKNFPKSLETSKKRCLTVVRRSRDLRPLSRYRSATFFENFYNCLERPKNVVWQSADGRVTSDHCRVTVQRLFWKIFLIAWNVWNVQKTLFDSRPAVAWPPTTVAWPFSDFFEIFPNCLKRPKNVVWQSADGRVTSDHCRVTVQRLFPKNF